MTQFDNIQAFTANIPKFTIHSKWTEDQLRQKMIKGADTLAKLLIKSNDPNDTFKLNKQDASLADIQNQFASILLDPLSRVPDTTFWQQLLLKVFNIPNNKASYLDQFLAYHLDKLSLPYPDPINAIYSYEDDVLPHVRYYMQTGQITEEFGANLMAYLTQYLAVNTVQIAVFPDQNAVNRALTSLNQSDPNKLHQLLTYAQQTPLPIFKLSPDLAPDSSWRKFMEQVTPFKTFTNIATEFVPSYFMVLNAETLRRLNDMTAEAAAQTASVQMNTAMKFAMLKASQIKSLPAVAKDAKSLVQQNTTNRGIEVSKLVNKFSLPKKITNPMKMAQALNKIVNNFTSQKESEIKFKTKHNSFTKANRRHPMDPNVPGRATKVKYRPNIMIHLDTSGSVTEGQYKNALLALLAIAKRKNIPIYFQSFSHYVSDIAYLDLRKYSVSQAYKILQMIPKVTGGTEYENVWSTINKTPDDFIHFMITDFEYSVSASIRFNTMPKVTNALYYVAFSEVDRQSVNDFARSMFHDGDYSIYGHIVY